MTGLAVEHDDNGCAEQRENSVERCDICGSSMTAVHCKLVCLNCGYVRDCSDQ
ncbi:MAG: hypothetical protein M1503_10300 [Thaumarchaeota archaeon]|nr:hypothetical protein [Nitrososphaerota archaeon]MCL5318631.1 hypothetical protein [Nitrososphaerota archaeon]